MNKILLILLTVLALILAMDAYYLHELVYGEVRIEQGIDVR